MHAASIVLLCLVALAALAVVALPFLDIQCAVPDDAPVVWEKSPIERARIRLEGVELGLAADRAFVAEADRNPAAHDPDLVGEARKRVASGEHAAVRYRAELAAMEAAEAAVRGE
jgi:hypothetical protein